MKLVQLFARSVLDLMDNHSTYACDLCSFSGKLSELSEHAKTCPGFAVQCEHCWTDVPVVKCTGTGHECPIQEFKAAAEELASEIKNFDWKGWDPAPTACAEMIRMATKVRMDTCFHLLQHLVQLQNFKEFASALRTGDARMQARLNVAMHQALNTAGNTQELVNNCTALSQPVRPALKTVLQIRGVRPNST